MSKYPLIYFTAISVAAHAALVGLWPNEKSPTPSKKESSIEIGLVVLPKLEQVHSSRKKLNSSPQSKPPAINVEHRAEAPSTPPPERIKVARAAKKMPEPVLSRVTLKEKDTERPIETAEPVKRQPSPSQAGSAPTTTSEAAPLYATNPAPRYPADALRHGWEGEVWLVVDVRRDGSVDQVRLEKSSGYPVLDRTATKAVRNWKFEPARIGTEATEGSVRVPVYFRIKRT